MRNAVCDITFRMLRTAVAACLLLAGCSDDPGDRGSPRYSDDPPPSAESDPCFEMLKDPAFGGEGRVFLSNGGGTRLICVVEFRAGDRALTQVGVHVSCHPQASIMISFDLADGEWSVNEAATDDMDNGACELSFVSPPGT